jgi:hypothetical protein
MRRFAPRRSVAILAATATLLAGCALPPTEAPIVSSGGQPLATAHRFSLLHSFTGPPDGGWPTIGRLVFDKAGNLYGATNLGGSGDCRLRGRRAGCGTIFELRPRRHGGWTERIIYSFKSLADGAAPYSTLTLDSAGDIYGVTISGGNRGCLTSLEYHGCGTVFELVPHRGAWKKHLLHAFSGGSDGGHPSGGLILDEGMLYGIARCGGGSYSCYGSGAGAGVFFGLARSGTHWTESVLCIFNQETGGYPAGDLTAQGRNTIFGTTAASIYEMSRSSPSVQWRETTLYLFPEGDQSTGRSPTGGLALDGSGNLYGVTAQGGDYSTCSQGCGVIFELSGSSGSSWSETVLHTFSGGSDGASSSAGVAMNAAGTLFGTTLNGGDLNCNGGVGCGVVFSLTPRGTASTEHVIHTFENGATDGAFPRSAVVLGSNGRTYGSTWYGGPGSSFGNGTVYEITR